MPKFEENQIIEIEGEVAKLKENDNCSGCVFNEGDKNCPKNRNGFLLCENIGLKFVKLTEKELTECISLKQKGITEYLQSKPILMGIDNPTGWKLEDLLQKIKAEIHAKSEKIIDSSHPQRDMILNNNTTINVFLSRAIVIQKCTYKQLDAVEPNHGPSNPRL